jgi:hypothetical protein
MPKLRRTQSESDSLELLLDTMCNTFGGIMFIAISLLIISSFVSKNTSPITTEDSRAIQCEIARLTSEIHAIRTKKTLKLSIKKGLEHSPCENLRRKCGVLNKENNASKKTMFELNTQIKKLDAKKEKLKNSNYAQQTKISNNLRTTSKIKAKLKKLKKKYRNLQNSESITENRKFVFSKLKTTTKRPIWCILSNNLLYRIESQGRMLVDDVEKIDNEDGGVRFKPIKGRGVRKNEFDDYLASLNKNRRYLALFVYPDSYASMVNLEKKMRKNRISFNWNPVIDCYDCVLYPIRAGDVFKSQ